MCTCSRIVHLHYYVANRKPPAPSTYRCKTCKYHIPVKLRFEMLYIYTYVFIYITLDTGFIYILVLDLVKFTLSKALNNTNVFTFTITIIAITLVALVLLQWRKPDRYRVNFFTTINATIVGFPPPFVVKKQGGRISFIVLYICRNDKKKPKVKFRRFPKRRTCHDWARDVGARGRGIGLCQSAPERKTNNTLNMYWIPLLKTFTYVRDFHCVFVFFILNKKPFLN